MPDPHDSSGDGPRDGPGGNSGRNGDTPGPRGRDPREEPIYRAILAVLAASVVVGALAAVGGEPLLNSPAVARAGVGMAVVCGILYWVFRLLGRRAARRQGHGDGEDG